MTRRRDEGVCYAYSKADGAAYALPRSEYSELLAAWTAGRAFFTGTTLHGAAITLRLGDIVAVSDNAPDHLASGRAEQLADEADDRRDEMLRGAE